MSRNLLNSPILVFVLYVVGMGHGLTGYAQPSYRLYDSLNVTDGPALPNSEVREAYLKIRRRLEPDAESGDEGAKARLREAGEAWNVLKNSRRRILYNRYGDSRMAWLDSIDHKTIEMVRAALGSSEGPWNELALQKVVRYYMARPEAMVRFFLLNPEYDYHLTANFYKGERAREFTAFLHRLRSALLAEATHRGDGRTVLDIFAIGFILKKLEPEPLEVYEGRYQMSARAEDAARVARELRLYVPDIFRMLIRCLLVSPEVAFKYLSLEILTEGAHAMTSDLEFEVWDLLLNLKSRMIEISDEYIYEDYKGHIVATLMRFLLASPLNHFDVRAALFRWMLNPSLAPFDYRVTPIAAMFSKRGNSAESKIAIETLRSFLKMPVVTTALRAYISTEREESIWALFGLNESLQQEALSSIREVLQHPLLDSKSKLALLESAARQEIWSYPLYQLFDRHLVDILPIELSASDRQIYRVEYHKDILEQQRIDVFRGIQKYKDQLEQQKLDSCKLPLSSVR